MSTAGERLRGTGVGTRTRREGAVIGPDLAQEVAALKAQDGRDMLLTGGIGAREVG